MLFRNQRIDIFLAFLLLLLLTEKWTMTAVESRMPISTSIPTSIDESSIIRQTRRRTVWRSRSWGDSSHRRQRQQNIEDTDIVMKTILSRYNFRGGDDTTDNSGETETTSRGLTADNTHNTKSEEEGKYLEVNGKVTTVVSVGIVDLSAGRRQTNQNHPIAFSSSSIVLLVDDDDSNSNNNNNNNNNSSSNNNNNNNTIDEIILRKLISPVLPTNKEEEEENAGTIVESLALLCDVLVIRITGNEDENDENNNIPITTNTLPSHLMNHIIHGNRQRKLAGMAKGKLWIMDTITTSTGIELQLRRISSNNQDDNDEEKEEEMDDNLCYSDNTTWSTLFSSSFSEQQNKIYNIQQIEELFTTLSRQVIIRTNNQQQHSTTLKSKLVPTVSAVKYLNIRDDDRIVQSSIQTTELENDNNDQQTSPSSSSSASSASSSSFAEEGSRRIKNANRIHRRKLQQNNNDVIVEDIMATARRRLEDLETKMQEIFLVDESSPSSSSSLPFNPMPILEFGSLVKDILDTTEKQLREETTDNMSDSFRRGIIKGIVVEVQRLYIDQLQALRNYYGQRYEAILDEEIDDEKNDVDEAAVERGWAIAAEHMTTAFQAAAENAAVPVKYRSIVVNDSNNDDVKNNHRRGVSSFDHIDALQGLIRDMMEATERRKNDQSIASMLLEEEEDDDEGSTSTNTRKRKRRVPKWLERIAARTFVFGVNYFQGWLAWQGIRRAAIERDRNQPKFPLF
ncbi:MAG: hypothetical protein ACI90V_008484 [Bacillariaceae sp.]|jgi:hypothetical protein